MIPRRFGAWSMLFLLLFVSGVGIVCAMHAAPDATGCPFGLSVALCPEYAGGASLQWSILFVAGISGEFLVWQFLSSFRGLHADLARVHRRGALAFHTLFHSGIPDVPTLLAAFSDGRIQPQLYAGRALS